MEIIKEIEKLEERCNEIQVIKGNNELRDLIIELKHTCIENKLSGLCANQIGEKVRMFCLRFSDDDLRTFINPMIVNAKGWSLSKETCPNIEGTYLQIRYSQITMAYTNPRGEMLSVKLDGQAAFISQQMIDLLNGVLVSDLGLKIDKDFEEASEEEKEEIIKMYLESLDFRSKQLKEEIEQDQTLKKINDGVNFMERVQKGEVQLESTPLTEEEKTQIDEKLKNAQK